jgi:hypothetical protein
VTAVSELAPILLKRDLLEKWCDELFEKFQSAVSQCLVYLAFQGKYYLTEVLDAVEVWRKEAVWYPLGESKKTNIQLKLRLGNGVKYMKMNVVSNKEPGERDLEYFREMTETARDAKSILKCLDRRHIAAKGREIEAIKKLGFKMNEKEKDLHIDRGIERGIKSGMIKG